MITANETLIRERCTLSGTGFLSPRSLALEKLPRTSKKETMRYTFITTMRRARMTMKHRYGTDERNSPGDNVGRRWTYE